VWEDAPGTQMLPIRPASDPNLDGLRNSDQPNKQCYRNPLSVGSAPAAAGGLGFCLYYKKPARQPQALITVLHRFNKSQQGSGHHSPGSLALAACYNYRLYATLSA
jgi:hypothetical protein